MKRIKNEHIIISDSQFLVAEVLKSLIEADERYTLAGVACNQSKLHSLLIEFRNALLIKDFANTDFQGIDDPKSSRRDILSYRY